MSVKTSSEEATVVEHSSSSDLGDRRQAVLEDDQSQGKHPWLEMEALEAIEEALSRLNRLGIAIRQSSSGSIATRVKRFADGLDLMPFEDLSYFSVQALYPNAHQALKDRLSRSMTHRYTTMLYLKSRKSMLQTRRTEPPPLMPTINEESKGPIEAREPNVTGMTRIQRPGMTRAIRPATFQRRPYLPSQSDLSSLNAEQLRGILNDSQKAGSRINKTSSIQINQENYPKPPGKNDTNIITCEWCFVPLTEVALEARNWRYVDTYQSPDS
jgi:hypothetical protein